MTKSEALTLLSCTVTQLALKLGISHNAISQWEEEKIPLAREYQIRDLAQGREPLKNKVVE
ncbi:Cro/CI family transcriptional regulator [Acinetobacter sp. V91_7]|uniref:Cro/CI family transcriptional regulator n=1 Tax=unclassified Acinetobacter TaxID=196816 RepID=UPI00287D0E82|nr:MULTISPECIES: Cro/CI family transcriptional regulator [unclassified Acinetobacter]MDS7935644.1 Cro/CI family transcriptional regulator [Acinetobacter sp. V91_4B]MDS7964748.1 Cro/CI family transcriptional regulator [Acinetobacter sp. V91_7]MDS8025557.1 Cro/CI family transcriptional regulator [Acinetobacter sp. V91_13]